MSLGIADARQRLGYINQYHEWLLIAMFALALSGRMLGVGVSWSAVALLGIWAAMAWSFVQVSASACEEALLLRIEVSYFIIELGLITLLGVMCSAPEWLILLLYLLTMLFANMVLPRSVSLGITALAGVGFSGLVLAGTRHPGHAWLALQSASRHPTLALTVGSLVSFAVVGFSMAQFALMLNRQGEALQAANIDLNETSRQLRMHRDHLEELVRDRTRELERANQRLKRLNEVKNGFLANVSHELRTPLTSIRSFSEILLRYPDEEAGTRAEFLEIIITESDRLTRLINDVLDLVKIEAGHLDLKRQPVRLADVVAPSLDLIQVAAAGKGLRLLNLLPDDLPLVHGDPDRLRQVFTNLLGNAVKFTDAGTIRVGAHSEEKTVVAFVSDTGIGVAAGERERIFEKFHQHGDVLTSKPDGTGLGLSICREIVDGHGGRIWTEPREPQGSIFFCALPRADRVSAAVGARAGARQSENMPARR